MEFQYVMASIIIRLGAFFLLVGSIGLIRLPDLLSRTHATGVLFVVLIFRTARRNSD